VLLSLGGVACGRALPEDTPAATGPAETGAFDEPASQEGTIKGVGSGAPHDYLAAVGKALEAEDPTVKLEVEDAEPDYDALCAGRIDVVAATGDAAKDVCGGKDAAVGFHLANAEAEPVVLYVNRDSILNNFEVEGLIQFAVDNGETLPAQAGLEPLSIDQLQETQTKLEQVIAGVG
jgi:ABC-type glycerol-3-phosphate transport system substrate-binding protein